MIEVTDKAKNHIITTLQGLDKPYLVFGLKGGGCAGFEYFWIPATTEEYQEKRSDDDFAVKLDESYTLIVDGACIDYVVGSIIDYHSDFVSSSLTVNNPQAVSSCGCGTSVAF